MAKTRYNVELAKVIRPIVEGQVRTFLHAHPDGGRYPGHIITGIGKRVTHDICAEDTIRRIELALKKGRVRPGSHRPGSCDSARQKLGCRRAPDDGKSLYPASEAGSGDPKPLIPAPGDGKATHPVAGDPVGSFPACGDGRPVEFTTAGRPRRRTAGEELLAVLRSRQEEPPR